MRNIQSLEQTKSDNKDIISLLLPSLLGIILCMFFVVSSTYAYFVASIPPSQHKIEAANFDVLVEVSVTDSSSGDNLILTPEADGTYYIEGNKTYNVIVTAQGSASTGYCIMLAQIDGNTASNKYYTNQIAQDTSLTFLLESDQDIHCSFVPSWGTYSGTYDISNGDIFQIPLSS